MPKLLGRSNIYYLIHFSEYIRRFGVLRLITPDLGEKKNNPQRHHLFNTILRAMWGTRFCLRDTILHVCHDGEKKLEAGSAS
jgi:hypothetical protein